MGQTLAQHHKEIERLDRWALELVYGHARVTDCKILDHMARRNAMFFFHPGVVQIKDQELENHLCTAEAPHARRLIACLPDSQLKPLMQTPAVVERVLRCRPHLFSCLPEAMKTEQVLKPLLDKLPEPHRHELLDHIAQQTPALARRLETIEDAIKRSVHKACATRANELTFALRCLAVQQRVHAIGLFQDMEDPEYSTLCDRALEHSGMALAYIRPSHKSLARVEQALKHRQAPGIEAIPRKLYTTDRLSRALPNSHSCLSRALLDDWNLWDALKEQHGWLYRLPEHERTEELCHHYLSRFPGDLDPIPAPILAQHPEWQTASERPCAYLPLELHKRLPSCYGPATGDSAGSPASSAQMKVQPWALVLAHWHNQADKLPENYRKAIRDNGGTGGLAQTLKVPPLQLDADALLDPVQEANCSRRAGVLPDLARIQLMSAAPFQLPRTHERQELLEQMDRHFQHLQQQLEDKSLPFWLPEPETCGAWKRRGGRTLVHSDKEDCIHMKLQREGESLNTFAAEQAVQSFARSHPQLGWHSEIPDPGDIYLVPLDKLPLASRAFPDKLKRYNYDDEDYVLAFRFTTQGDNYDTLAWQPDEQGRLQQSHQGLLNALHDLGIWSSMGAMHTSTIRLYHHFYDVDDASRPELLLTALFRPEEPSSDAGYPGILHLWNTWATDQSDWGQSGLRDLGDLEFYPFIETYITSSDAVLTAPDYGQRASFVNAIAQNIFGGLLHYMRLHRTCDPSWHYKNTTTVAELGKFIEDGCNTLLGGLLDDHTRIRDLFPAADGERRDVYAQWLHLTAREIIYWSARQETDSDCFAKHLATDGHPSAELYPGQPCQDILYGEHYTEAQGENLGANNGKMPLFYLVRGLYVMAIGLANRLGEPHHEPV